MVVLIYHLKKEMQLFYREEDSMGLSENKKQEIYFKNIELMCNIGVYKHEKEKPQRVIVNLKILLSDTLNPKNDKKIWVAHHCALNPLEFLPRPKTNPKEYDNAFDFSLF